MLEHFNYVKPANLKLATSLLHENKGAVVLAGGTDLLVEIRAGEQHPRFVIDIKGIKELSGISRRDNTVSIGATATVTDLLESPELNGPLMVLKDAARVFGCLEIRHRATVGGNLAHGSPGSEFGTALSVFDTRVELASSSGQREMPLSEFLTGAGRTAMKSNEILTRILVPLPPPDSRGTYRRSSRVRGMDLAAFSCAVLIINPQEVSRREVRVAVGAMNPVPTRVEAVEQLLHGKPWTAKILDKMEELIKAGLKPRATSLRATPEYKLAVVGILCRRALEDLCPRT